MLDSSMSVTTQEKPTLFSEEQLDIVTRDPATFALNFLVLGQSKWLIKDLYSKVPSVLHELLDGLLARLSASGVIEMTESSVEVKKTIVDSSNPGQLQHFLPKIFEIATNKVLEKSTFEVKSLKEGVRYYVLPDDPSVADELLALFREFSAKVENLRQKTRSSTNSSQGHRLVGVTLYKMETEDFV